MDLYQVNVMVYNNRIDYSNTNDGLNLVKVYILTDNIHNIGEKIMDNLCINEHNSDSNIHKDSWSIKSINRLNNLDEQNSTVIVDDELGDDVKNLYKIYFKVNVRWSKIEFFVLASDYKRAVDLVMVNIREQKVKFGIVNDCFISDDKIIEIERINESKDGVDIIL